MVEISVQEPHDLCRSAGFDGERIRNVPAGGETRVADDAFDPVCEDGVDRAGFVAIKFGQLNVELGPGVTDSCEDVFDVT